MDKVAVFDSAMNEFRLAEKHYKAFMKRMEEIGVKPISGFGCFMDETKKGVHIYEGIENVAEVVGADIERLRYPSGKDTKTEGFTYQDYQFFECVHDKE